MLTQQEETRVRESIAGVASLASQVIQRAADPWQAIGFVNSLHASIDKVIATENSDDLKAECKPGCSFCCSAKVEISDAEALHIARGVGELPRARQEELVKALCLQSTLLSKSSDSDRVPCAFLEQGLCSIYSYRPATCRKAHSLSVKACEAQEPQIPQNLGVSLQCEVLITGTNRAFDSVNLAAARNELSAAVLAALTTHAAAEAWYNGKPLLQPSSAHSTEAHSDIAQPGKLRK